MTPSARRRLRGIVSGLATVRPFSAALRLPYARAEGRFARLCAGLPGISGAWRYEATPGDPLHPGLSDLDVAAGLRDARPGDEGELLERFWTGYRRLQRRFPMLQDAILLDPEDLARFAEHPVLRADVARLRPLGGEPPPGAPAPAAAHDLWYRADRAWRLYAEQYIPHRIAGIEDAFGRRFLSRLAGKILRLCGGTPAGSGPSGGDVSVCAGLERLLVGVAASFPGGEEVRLDPPPVGSPAGILAAREALAGIPEAPAGASLAAIPRPCSGGDVLWFLVVESPGAVAAAIDYVRANADRFARLRAQQVSARPPVVVPRNCLTPLLSSLRPAEGMLWNGTRIERGEPLPGIPPAGGGALRARLSVDLLRARYVLREVPSDWEGRAQAVRDTALLQRWASGEADRSPVGGDVRALWRETCRALRDAGSSIA